MEVSSGWIRPFSRNLAMTVKHWKTAFGTCDGRVCYVSIVFDVRMDVGGKLDRALESF
jgi:hypothetical protein